MDRYAELIGTPFMYGGRGPDSYDCYGLLKYLMRDDGIDLPDYASPSDGRKIAAIFATQIQLWERCEEQPGVAMYIRLNGNAHVGYCIGNGRFIHTWEKSNGVCIEKIKDWEVRTIGFYKYVG